MKRTELPKNGEHSYEVSADFSSLQEQKPEVNPFQTLIEQQNILFNEVHNESVGELIDCIQEMAKDGQLYLVMKEVFERGRKETHYLDGLIETGIYQALIDGDLGSKYVDGQKVTWKKEEEHTGGAFHKRHGVRVKGKIPEISSIMISLIDEGKFPDNLKTLYHELIHSKQVGKESKKIDEHFQAAFEPLQKGDLKGSLEKLKGYFHKMKKGKFSIFELSSTELMEAQAYRTSEFPSDTTHPADIVDLILNVKDSKGNPEYKVKKEKLTYAIEIIDIFQALGYSIEDIGKLIQLPSPWDSDKNNYPNIERVLEEELQKRNITRYELEKLKTHYRIGQQIERFKMVVIAREEVKKWKAQKEAKTLAEAV